MKNKMKLSVLFTFLFAALTITAISVETQARTEISIAGERSEKALPQKQPDFFETEWKLTKIEGKAVKAAKAFIRFNKSENSAGGNGGCNGFGGNLEKNQNRIKISDVISTKMYCKETSKIENKFLSNLDRVTKYRIANGKLILTAGERDVLEFVKRN
jgi:heat shock protein HslJ